MIGVAFAHTQVETFVQQWEYVLSHFAPDVLFSVGGAPPQSNVLAQAQVITDAGDLPNGPELVLLAPTNGLYVQGDVSLVDFVHPTDAIYWFGSDANHQQLEAFEVRAPDHKVFIPTDSPDQMYSFMAWGVTAWDRRMKGG